MNKVGHTIGGIIVTGIAVYNIDQSILNESLMAIGIMSGSFLPDLDANYSYIKSKVKILGRLYDKLPQNELTQHRGALLHSILTLLPFIPFYKFSAMLGLGLGIFGHHICDLFSNQGLRYFYPFKVRIRIK